MPITQDRMIDLIREVERCQQARDQLVSELRQTLKLWAEELFTPTEAMDSIVLLVNQQYELSLPAYATEKAHFLKHEARNEKKQRYAAGQRRMQGIPQGPEPRRNFAKPERHQTTNELPDHYRARLAKMEQEEFAQKQNSSIDYSIPPPTISSSGWKPMPTEALPRKNGDAIPDLSEYEAEPPDFKKGIF